MTASDLTQERIGLNQARFREANDRIQAAADRAGAVDPVPFVCECPDRSCVELVRLTPDAYEDIRRDPTWFFNAPGHQRIAVEAGAAVVLASFHDYVVLEKVGEAARVAREEYETADG